MHITLLKVFTFTFNDFDHWNSLLKVILMAILLQDAPKHSLARGIINLNFKNDLNPAHSVPRCFCYNYQSTSCF